MHLKNYSGKEACVRIKNAVTFNYLCVNLLSVKTYWCSSCKGYINYDGYNDGILNMGSYLIGHDVMRQYMQQYLTEGLEYLFLHNNSIPPDRFLPYII